MSGFQTRVKRKVKIKSQLGSIQLSDTWARGGGEASTQFGAVRATRVAGNLRLESQHGSIVATGNWLGDIHGKSQFGSVKIYQQNGGDVIAETQFGHIDLNVPDADSEAGSTQFGSKKLTPGGVKKKKPRPGLCELERNLLGEDEIFRLALELSKADLLKTGVGAGAGNSVSQPTQKEESEGIAQVAEKKEDTCIICMDKEVCSTKVFVPCGHAKWCEKCADEFEGKPCPYCRKTVTSVLKVFK